MTFGDKIRQSDNKLLSKIFAKLVVSGVVATLDTDDEIHLDALRAELEKQYLNELNEEIS